MIVLLTYLNIPFRLLFYATLKPTRIYKAKLHGNDVVEIVSTGLTYVPSIAINYDKKRICWADYGKCCTSLSPKNWVSYSILSLSDVNLFRSSFKTVFLPNNQNTINNYLTLVLLSFDV